MSPKSFAILALATAASIGLAVSAIAGRETPTRATATSEPLFPGLLDHANEIARIQVASSGGKLTVEAGEKGWSLVEKSGYPVPADQVRKLALAVGNLQLVEAKTADPERLKRLELEDPTGEGFKSRQVEIIGRDGRPLAALIVGKSSPGLYGGGRGGVYARRAGENQAWLAAGELGLPSDPLDLIGRDVIDVPASDVARVVLQPRDGAPVALSRPNAEATEFTTDAVLPEGRKLDQVKIEELTTSLSNLSMQDVRPTADVTMPPDATKRSRFETFDGLAVEVAVAKLGEGDAAELGGKLHNWAFRLPPYMADRLVGGLDQLLAEPEPAS
jgi:hypothetical protein